MTHPHDNPVRAELQSLDQRRADTLADALRPDSAPTGGAWLDSSDAVPGSWHWTGAAWEHGGHANMPPQAGHFPARHFASVADAITHATASVTAERDAALAAVDAVRADYAPRREPPTADEVRALAGLWGDGIDTQWVACFDADTHVATVVFVGFDFAGDVACRSFVGSRLDAGAFATWEARGPTGPVAWSELARLVEGVRRG